MKMTGSLTRFLLLFLLLIPKALFAQIEWGHQLGTEHRENLQGHVVGPDGNIIAVGYFGGTLSFNNLELRGNDNEETFLYKTTPSGEILWSKVLSSPSFTGGVGVSTDSQGNIYVAGCFIDKLILEGEILLSGNERWNSYICKFNKQGGLLWASGIIGQTDLSEARVGGNVSAGPAGESVVGVNFHGTVKAGGHTIINSGAGGSTLLLVKYSVNGTLDWYLNLESETNVEVNDVHINAFGDVFMTGLYTGKLSLGESQLQSTSELHGDVFIAKINKSGSPVWVKGFNKSAPAELNNAGNAMIVDPVTQELYLAGDFKGSIDIDGVLLEGENTHEEQGIADIFLTKLTPEGAVIWAKRLGSPGNDMPWDIKVRDDSVIISGTWYSSPFIQSISKDGNPGTAILLNTSGFATNVTPLENNKFYISGLFYGSFEEENFSWNDKGQGDGFLLKLGRDCSEQAFKPILSSGCNSIKIKNYSGTGIVKWYKDDVEIKPQSITEITNPANGSYRVSIQTHCGSVFSEKLQFHLAAFLPVPPVLQVGCSEIVVLNQEKNTISWYKDDQPLLNEEGSELQLSGAGTYTVQYENDCGIASTSATIESSNSTEKIKRFNVITPNDDNMNEYFTLDSVLLGASLQVYNRWGNMVFSSSKYQNDWNGQGLAGTVYYWVANHQCYGIVRGTLTILRK